MPQLLDGHIGWVTPAGAEHDVAVLQDGKLRGDSGMAHVGSYQRQGQLFTAATHREIVMCTDRFVIEGTPATPSSKSDLL